jgi:hypothetical protein
LNRVPPEARITVVTESQIAPAAEVREKFRRVKPLKDIAIAQRGWTLDVLNIVRRLVSEGRAPRDPNSGKMGRRRTPPSDSFNTADAYIFERELEQLHPDNRNIKANPVNKTTRGRRRKRLRLTRQEFASNFRNFATGIYFCMLTATAGVCRESPFFSGNCDCPHWQLLA